MASDYGRAPAVLYDASQSSYWENQQYVNEPTMIPSNADGINLSQCTVKFQRTEATGIREDIAEFSLFMFVDTGVSTPTANVDAAQAAAVESALDTWWTAEKSLHTAHWLLAGYQWRNISADGPISAETGFVLPRPTWRSTSRSVVGTAAAPPNPDSSAVSVTFVTASRKHWGRVYLPAVMAGRNTNESRLTSATCDSIAGNFDTLLNALGTQPASIVPVVWSPKYRGCLTLVALKCDDVPDVVRRRRPKIKTYEKRYENSA